MASNFQKRSFRSTTNTSTRSGTTNRYGTPRKTSGSVRGRTLGRSRIRRESTLIRRRVVQRRGAAVKGAQNQLKRFKQGSILAVAITGFLLMVFAPAESGYSQDAVTADTVEVSSGNRAMEGGLLAQATDDAVNDSSQVAGESQAAEEAVAEDEEVNNEPITRAAREEAVGAFQNLWKRFYENLPKLLVAIAILFVTWLFARFLKWLLPKMLGKWERAGAIITLVNICVWLFAIGLAVTVVVGDIRAMVGSLGLIGLALSWSLQTPIESFTGWLINSFKGYYRIGDRISVGDVVGDVYKIDFLTTTVWEIGSPFREGYLQAEQPTGRLVTFPNNEVLSGSVVNYTSDFPYVWDELVVGVANESDIKLAMQVLEEVAMRLLGDYMKEPAQHYVQILKQAGLHYDIPNKPQVFLSTTDSWTNVIIRYLVGARERRKWKTELILLTAEATGKPEYQDKIIPVYTRQQIQMINVKGEPVSLDSYEDDEDDQKA
jgi:small-conductance mechanosensitive channel